eukprot:IDg22755t1
MGKGQRTAIPKTSNRQSKSLLELVYSDVIGPFETESIGGARYVITFIDDKSKWTVEYTMHRKSESLDCFKRHKAYAERHTNQAVQNSYLDTHGIKHELTVAYTPQQNGVAERMNRTLLNLGDISALSPNVTPYHIWHNTSPDLSHMRVFGSLSWYVVPSKKWKKLDASSREAMLMGYSNQSKCYKLWDEEIENFIVSRDVSFDEESSSSTPREKEQRTSNFENRNELPEEIGTDADGSMGALECDINLSTDSPNQDQALRRSSRISKPSAYAHKIIDRFNMADSKSCATPMELQSYKESSIVPEDSNASKDIPYRQAISSIMYLALGTRPDISFAVGRLAQYCNSPLQSHWKAVKRILRYINGTKNLGLTYIGSALSWKSKKQSIIATSSCKADYISSCSAAKEAIWLSRLLAEIRNTGHSQKIPIFMDNQGAIASSKNQSINSRNKHIDIRYHYVRNAVSENQITIHYLSNL